MKTIRYRFWLYLGITCLLLGMACNVPIQLQGDPPTPVAPSLETPNSQNEGELLPSGVAPEPSWSISGTNTPLTTMARATDTALPTSRRAGTATASATISPSPTFTFPRITASMQANCRYGPGTAYLYAHGMYPGDGGTVWGRNYSGTWLWIQPDNIEYQCWISIAVVEVQGDIFTVTVAPIRLPHSSMYGPPEDVAAVRDGDEVMVTWSEVSMTEDDFRGYLLEVTVCQAGSLVWLAVHTDELFYIFTDEQNCDSDSGGLLYTVEKHGYTDPVNIPWP